VLASFAIPCIAGESSTDSRFVRPPKTSNYGALQKKPSGVRHYFHPIFVLTYCKLRKKRYSQYGIYAGSSPAIGNSMFFIIINNKNTRYYVAIKVY
jgi:hypothetical protein